MNKEHVRVLKNIISLLFLQGSNYIVPLLVLPYLVIVLGIEQFGLYSFVLGVISIFRAFASYGFDVTATKDIARNRDDSAALRDIFSDVMIAKFFLLLMSFSVLTILFFTVERIGSQYSLYILAFLLIVGDFIFPTWLFYGLEKMSVVTYLKVIYKIVFSVLVFIYVKNSDDLWLVLMLDGIGAVISGILSLIYACRLYSLHPRWTSYQSVFKQFKGGIHVFFSSMSVIMYSTINTVVIGFMLNNVAVGYFSVAEKIYSAMRGMLNPVIQALLPYMSRLYIDKSAYYKFVRKLCAIFFMALCSVSFITYIFSEFFLDLLMEDGVSEAIKLLRIFSVSLIFAIGGLFSNMLVIKGRGALLSKLTFISMVINLSFIYPAVFYFDVTGAAVVFLIVQVVQALFQLYYNREIFCVRC